ncbi:hypothetical protein ADK38_12840, partial [Streptomyces varsoviensis]
MPRFVTRTVAASCFGSSGTHWTISASGPVARPDDALGVGLYVCLLPLPLPGPRLPVPADDEPYESSPEPPEAPWDPVEPVEPVEPAASSSELWRAWELLHPPPPSWCRL